MYFQKFKKMFDTCNTVHLQTLRILHDSFENDVNECGLRNTSQEIYMW